MIAKGPSSHEILVGKDSKLTRFELGQVPFTAGRRKLPENLLSEWVVISDQPGASSYYWRRKAGEKTELEGITLIGSVLRRDMHTAGPDIDQYRLLSTGDRNEDMQRHQEGYLLEEMAPYLKFIVPAISRDDDLIGISNSSSLADTRFHLLGKPRKVSPIE